MRSARRHGSGASDLDGGNSERQQSRERARSLSRSRVAHSAPPEPRYIDAQFQSVMNGKLAQLEMLVHTLTGRVTELTNFKSVATAEIEKLLQKDVASDARHSYADSIPARILSAEQGNKLEIVW